MVSRRQMAWNWFENSIDFRIGFEHRDHAFLYRQEQEVTSCVPGRLFKKGVCPKRLWKMMQCFGRMSYDRGRRINIYN